MEEIIKKIRRGELTRETDESGSGGFWDTAYEIYGKPADTQEQQELIERIYNTLWETYESTL